MVIVLLVLLILSWMFMLFRERKKATIKYDGKIVITVEDSGKKIFSLELDGQPEDLETKETVAFKIVKSEEDEEAA